MFKDGTRELPPPVEPDQTTDVRSALEMPIDVSSLFSSRERMSEKQRFCSARSGSITIVALRDRC